MGARANDDYVTSRKHAASMSRRIDIASYEHAGFMGVLFESA